MPLVALPFNQRFFSNPAITITVTFSFPSPPPSTDRRSLANLSHAPLFGANHAPVVIAFPAAAAPTPLADATSSQTGSDAAALEARRQERENFYADVDAENNSMRGTLC